jgi:hypothetical protein
MSTVFGKAILERPPFNWLIRLVAVDANAHSLGLWQ